MISMLNRPPVARQVPLLGYPHPSLAGYRPLAPAWRPARPRRQLAQVEVNPTVNAPITIELGTLPVTLGAFAASGVSFLVGSQVKSIKTVTDMIGVGFAGFGIVNLFLGGSAEASAQETEDAVDGPEGVDAGASNPIEPTNEEAFLALDGRVLYPTEAQEVNLGMTDSAVPIRVRVVNSVSKSVTFDLVLTHTENPNIGEVLDTVTSMRVTLGPGQTRDIDVDLPLTQWRAWVDYVEVDVLVQKRRIHGGNAQRLATDRFFVVE